MGGKTSQTATTNQQTISQPWQPAQPALHGILSGVQSQLPNYQLNPAETGAIGQMTANAQGTPNYAPQAQGLADKFLTGDPTGLLGPALQKYMTALSPFTTGDMDPTKTPGIMNLLSTIRDDITNQIRGQFAGAGRDMSGMETGAIARGVSQGTAAPLLNQYNENVRNRMAAAGGMFGAAGNTAGAMTGNQGNAFNLIQAIPELMNMGPQGVLQAQQLLRQIPMQNLGMAANLAVPIAGLGGQTNSTGQSQSSTSHPWWQPVAAVGSLWK